MQVSTTTGRLSGYAYSLSAGFLNFADSEVIVTGLSSPSQTGPSTGGSGSGGGGGGGGSITSGSSHRQSLSADSGQSLEQRKVLILTQIKSIVSVLQARGIEIPSAILTLVNLSDEKILVADSSNTTTKSDLLAQLKQAPDLEWKDENAWVKLLQQYLNQNGFMVNEIAGQPGSIGYETNKFGDATRAALVRYQQSHNITPAEGYFGSKTRDSLK